MATQVDVPPVDLPWPGGGDGRPLLRRRSLPRGRAVVGGFLIALAAVVTFWAYSGASHSPRQWYVVAARTLIPGERIGASDVRVVALDMPDAGVRAQLFGTAQQLIGASVLAPISAGALVEASEVVGRAGAPGTREISFSVDRSRAVGGTLKPGEFVDVLATLGQGASSSTLVVVAHVEVLSVAASGSDSAAQIVILAAPDATSAEGIADAAIATELTLVRSAEQPPGSPVTTAAPFQVPGEGP